MVKLYRKTKQKLIIKEEITKMNSFFTGEELFGKIKKNGFNIGLATIYRFLKDMRDKNLIHSFNCEKKIIYSKNMKNHCHLICEKCKKIVHLNIENLDFMKLKGKFEVCHFQIDIYGLCEKCQNCSF